MTQSVDIVRAIYDAVAQADLDGALFYVAETIKVTQAAALPFGGLWHGHDGFRRMGAAIYTAWPDFTVTPERFLAEGDTVLVMTRVAATARDGRPALNQPMIERWRVADDRAVECQPFYFDTAAAASSAAQSV